MSIRTREQSDSGVQVPPVNEHPYYVARITRTMRYGRDAERYLNKYSLSTLKLIDKHRQPSDITDRLFQQHSETSLRNVLLISGMMETENSLTSVQGALDVLMKHHELSSEDLTKLPGEQAEMISTAAYFLITTGFGEFAPPVLTHFVMSNRDCVEDIIDYVKERYPRRDNVHNIDLDQLSDYLDNPTKALREGTL